MAKKKRITPEIGDVFAIPIDETRYGYGQVIEPSIVVVYDLFADSHPAVEEIVKQPVLMLVNTQLVDVEDGDWPLVGKADAPEVEYPIYKTYTSRGYMIIDLAGRVLREATKEEEDTLPNRKSYTNGVITLALKAKLGLTDWLAYMDNLLYKGA